MNLKFKQARRIALKVSLACLTPLLVSAEHVSFNLPIEARWGSATLRPGEYTFDIPLASTWPQEIDLAQNDGTVRIFPIIESGGVGSDQDYLLLVQAGGSYFVREYVSGTTGKRFIFGKPKNSLPVLITKAAAKQIPVDSHSH